MFWTVPISPRQISYDLAKGTARFHLRNYPVWDFVNFGNSLLQGPQGQLPNYRVPARVTFDIRWKLSGPTLSDRNDAERFAWQPRLGVASIKAHAEREGYTFDITKSTQEDSLFAAVGPEQNGVYYPGY